MKTILVLVFGAAACTSGGLAQTQTIGAAGGEITVSADVDPQLAGVQLVIPPGAVPEGTAITISRGDPQNESGETGIGPSVRLSPTLVLTKPATLFVPYPPHAQPSSSGLAAVETTLGQRRALDGLLVSTAAELAQVQLVAFGDVQVVAQPCGDGEGNLNEIDLALAPNDIAWSPGAADDIPWTYDFSYPQSDGGAQPPTKDVWDGGVPSTGTGDGDSGGYVTPPTCSGAPQPTWPVDLAVQP